MTSRDIRDWLVHLRLKFQFYLSPIFLWGFVIADGRLDRALVLGYVSFHLFGYAGGTAFNSFYDRDTGPIGGLEHPPPIPRGLLPFSIAWQLAGMLIALLINEVVAAIYAVMFCLSIAYSHPRLRFKGKPLAALATVALGQGVLGYLGGWATARGEIGSALTDVGLLGAAAATLITVGFYPLTEIYQIGEDTRRGDRTLAIWLGPSRAFRFAMTCLVAGGSAGFMLVLIRYRALEGAALALFLFGVLAAVWRWSRVFGASDVTRNFKTCMRLYAFLSLGFAGWIGLHLTGVL